MRREQSVGNPAGSFGCWTVVGGSDLEEGESQHPPVWSRHVGDLVLESSSTRRVAFAVFMVEALGNGELTHEATAIVGCRTRRRSRMPLRSNERLITDRRWRPVGSSRLPRCRPTVQGRRPIAWEQLSPRVHRLSMRSGGAVRERSSVSTA